MKAINLEAQWQDPTIQTAPTSYQVLDIVHNILSTLSATACNIPQYSIFPTIITVPAANPYFLISPTINHATLTIDLNVTIHKCWSTCIYIPTIMSGSPSP